MNKRIKKKVAIRMNPFEHHDGIPNGTKQCGVRHRARNMAMTRYYITIDKCNLIPIEECKQKMCEEFSEEVFQRVYNKLIEYIHYIMSVKRDAIRSIGPILGIRQFERRCQYCTFPIVINDDLSLLVRVRVKYNLARFTFRITHIKYSVL